MKEFIKSIILLIVLLNPFLIIVYLVDIVKKTSGKLFTKVLLRAGIISFIVFSLFAILGDAIFNDIINASFSSFQIFGGIIFLLIGIKFIFNGGTAIEALRGESKHIAGAIAMPIFIGPGTISYSVLIGKKLDKLEAILAIGITIFICISVLCILKMIHDKIHTKKEELIEQYFEITGRITALIIGSISIEMIANGIISKFNLHF